MSDEKILTRKSTQPIISLLGKELFYSIPTDEASTNTQKQIAAVVEKSLLNMKSEPKEPVHYILAGFYTWLLRDLSSSLEIFDKGTENCPESYELYWYKTLLKTTMRDLAGAIADAERATELIEGIPDHGIDQRVFVHLDPHGHRSSTIHFMIWYHLGMAYYLNGDLEKAKQAYIECNNFIYGNCSLVSRSCWFYPVLRELGEYDQAAALIAGIDDDIKIIADLPYGEQSLLFKGTLSVEDVQARVDGDGKLHIIHEYAIAYWHYTQGNLEIAKVLFERVCARPEIGAYVQIAAEAKLKSLLET